MVQFEWSGRNDRRNVNVFVSCGKIHSISQRPTFLHFIKQIETDSQTHGQTDGWTDGWADVQTDTWCKCAGAENKATLREDHAQAHREYTRWHLLCAMPKVRNEDEVLEDHNPPTGSGQGV